MRWGIPAVMGLGLLVGGALALRPGEAGACGACECAEPVTAIVEVGSRDVPRNVRLFVSLAPGATAAQLTLASVAGVAVPLRREATGGKADTYWLVPEALLAAETEYVLSAGGPEGLVHFRTGSWVDTEPPSLAAAQVVDVRSSPLRTLCTPAVGVTLRLSGIDVAHGGALPLADVEVTTGGRTVRRLLRLSWGLEPGTAHVSFGHALPSTDGEATARQEGCLGDAELGETPEGSARVQVRLVDFAGQVSAPLLLDDVPLSSTAPAGCPTSEAPDPLTGTSEGGAAGGQGVSGCGAAHASPGLLALLMALFWGWERRPGRRRG